MIDVIIPAYNAHDTIRTTLMSLACQRLCAVLDVYIIDDGSKEGYDSEVEYFRNHKFFHSINVIPNEKNMGVGFSRRHGMEVSKDMSNNPWVFFIDSDDYMATPYAFNEYLHLADKNPNAKLIYSSINQEQNDLTDISGEGIDNIALNYKDLISTDHLGNILYLHGRIYSRKAIEGIGLQFPTTRSNEDIAFNMAFFQIYNKLGEIVFTPEDLACTNYNVHSITRSKNSTRGTPEGMHSCNEMYDCYLACSQTISDCKRYYSETGKIVSALSLSNYVDKFMIDTIKISGDTGWRSDEERELWGLCHALYYKDIIVPLLKWTPVAYEFKNNWFHNELKWGYVDTPEINERVQKYIKNIKNVWNEERFNELAPKYLTDRGYSSLE